MVFRICLFIAERIALSRLIVDGNSFSSPWIPKALENAGAPVTQQILFEPAVLSYNYKKYLFIDNYMPGIMMRVEILG